MEQTDKSPMAENLTVQHLVGAVMKALDLTGTKDFDTVTIPIGMMKAHKVGQELPDELQIQFTLTKVKDIQFPPQSLAVGTFTEGRMAFEVMEVPCCGDPNCTSCNPAQTVTQESLKDVLRALIPKGNA